ncbi:MAG: hypothetical protein RL154_613 [Pseudomonadota bacterium]|jgi:flagellar basal-body rod protein FlgG
MINGYYNAAGGMITQMNRLDIISNNLANLNTTGFKRDDIVIGDYERLSQEYQDKLPYKNQTKEAAQYLNHSLNRVPHIVDKYTEFTQGPVQATAAPLDFNLKQGDTFFAVETPEGVRYTRSGDFTQNAQGRLVTKDGYPVLPNNYFSSKSYINIPEGADVIVNTSGGLVYNLVDAPLSQLPLEPTDNLMVVKFDNLQKLKKEGNNLYRYDGEDAPTVANDLNLVAQGFLEKSNVNGVKEMTSLIEVSRLVGMYQKVMDMQMNDLQNEAINKLANARA